MCRWLRARNELRRALRRGRSLQASWLPDPIGWSMPRPRAFLVPQGPASRSRVENLSFGKPPRSRLSVCRPGSGRTPLRVPLEKVDPLPVASSEIFPSQFVSARRQMPASCACLISGLTCARKLGNLRAHLLHPHLKLHRREEFQALPTPHGFTYHPVLLVERLHELLRSLLFTAQQAQMSLEHDENGSKRSVSASSTMASTSSGVNL